MSKDRDRDRAVRPPLSPWVVRGGLFVFLGYVILAVSDFSFANVTVDAGALATVYAIGEILIGFGFLLVILGIARRLQA